jgi:hypothetical protein
MDINEFSTPINKTASLVVQQPSQNDLDDIESQRYNAKRALYYWFDQHRDNNPAALAKIDEIKETLGELKRRRKAINAAISQNMHRSIVDVCRGRFSKEEWAEIIFIAKERHIKAQEACK